ncbi:MAG: condensation domain-containing protein [Mycobacteriaceae bacterium]|uniref:condensation domain-containing protein n=1 Tax=Corynebacterium sp. TaxID=1720 RepID=UPI003F9B7D3A
MEYTELSSYRLHPGTLSVWTPTAPEDAWSDDPRPLSPNHEDHLREARRNEGATPRGDNWIGTAFRMYAPFDADAFRRTLRAWIARHEAYRTTATGASGTPSDGVRFRRRTVSGDNVDVVDSPGPGPLDSTQVRARLEHHFATQVSALDWPHLTVATIQPDQGNGAGPAAGSGAQHLREAPESPWFTVVFAADHAVMDAYTQIVSIAELRELYRAALENRPCELPVPASHIDFSHMETQLADSLTPDHPAVDRWRRYLSSVPGEPSSAPVFPLPLGDGGGGTRQASTSVLLLSAADADAFNDVSKRLGGNQASGLLAALKIAYSRTRNNQVPGEVSPLRYVMPMHTRNAPEYALSAGWFVGLMPVEDPAVPEELFSQAILTTKAATTVNRDLVAYPFPRVAELAGVPGAPQFVISFVDTRHIPGSKDWTAHDRTLRGTAYSDTDVYFWIVRNADGLNISMRYPNNPTALASLRSLITEYFTVLHSVVDTGDAYSVPFRDPRSREPVQAV